jgi:hypothetical protein
MSRFLTRCSLPGLPRPVVVLLAVLALAGAGCSKAEPDAPRARASLEGARLVVVGAVPQFPATAFPVTGGFFEDARWDEEMHTLLCKGWAPVDVRDETVRFVLRDPHDRLRLVGTPVVTPYERADVAASFPDRPELLHAGFTARIGLENLPPSPRWMETLEFYCLEADGTCHRLTPLLAPERKSWDRAPDRFTIALTYSAPAFTTPDGTAGSLDVCEPLPDHVAHLTGWAPFDGASPASTLLVQLDPRLAPASIQSATMLPRPDVRAAVDPSRETLDRSGFELYLKFNGTIDDLKQRGALRLWCIDGAGQAVEVGLPALR